MKIVHFSSTFLPIIGGAEIAIHNIALQQYKAGHEVSVISLCKSWRKMSTGVPYRLLPLLPYSMSVVLEMKKHGFDMKWVVGIQLALYQKIYDFDVWNVHLAYPAGFLAAPTLKRMRIPCLLTCHGFDIQTLPEIGYGIRLDPIVEQDIKKSVIAFDRVAAISESIRSEFLDIGVLREKIRNVSNGVDASRIKSLPVDRDRVRADMGWPSNKKILLTVGRNHPKKGYRFIPEIVKQVAAVRTDFLWVIVGRCAEPIAETAHKLGVSDYLKIVPQIAQKKTDGGRQTFTVPTEELINIYKATDMFVFPSLLEAFGIVLVEAMSAGLPIVTTDAPGCRDLVKHKATGLISSVGDTASMAKNILLLLGDFSLREALGRNGKLCSEQYEWKNVASNYCAVYDEIIQHSIGRIDQCSPG